MLAVIQIVIEPKCAGCTVCQKILFLVGEKRPSGERASVQLLVDFDRELECFLLVFRVDVRAIHPFKLVDIYGGGGVINAEILQARERPDKEGELERGVKRDRGR